MHYFATGLWSIKKGSENIRPSIPEERNEQGKLAFIIDGGKRTGEKIFLSDSEVGGARVRGRVRVSSGW